MGMINDIQQRVSALIGPKGVGREANSAYEKFMGVASMRESELNDAISKLKTISEISSRIGQATEKNIDSIKANTPLDAYASSGGNSNSAKISRAHQLKVEFSDMQKHDKTGFGELYDDTHDIRESYQNSLLASLSNEAKVNALAAICRCESAGAGKLADSLRLEIDAKQCAVDNARDGVISQFRLTTEALAKNDPQAIFNTEIGRQEAHAKAAERQMKANEPSAVTPNEPTNSADKHEAPAVAMQATTPSL